MTTFLKIQKTLNKCNKIISKYKIYTQNFFYFHKKESDYTTLNNHGKLRTDSCQNF